MKRMIFISVFSLLVSACGSGVGDGSDVSGIAGDSKTNSKVVFANAVTTTKAKVYLGSGGDIFTVSNSGTMVYGNTGNDTITIASGVTNVILDQNIEQVNFSDQSSIYTFKQTGNMINVYDASGATLIAKAPVQGDADGTVLSFSDKTASVLLTGGVMTLGGATVSPTTATAINIPTTTTSTTSAVTSTTSSVTSTTTTIPTGSVTVKW